MALILQAQDVSDLLPMEKAIGITEDLIREQAAGQIRPHTPIRLRIPNGSLRIVSGVLLGSGVMGARLGAASGMPGDSTFLALFDTATGNLLCLMVYPFGTLRTGATIGVATKWLAPPAAATVGLIGTGRNAFGLLQAMALVRPIRLIRVYSRNAEHRTGFAERTAKLLGIEVEPAASPHEALAGADLVTSSTNSFEPVFAAADVADDAHVNSMGSPNEVPETVWQNAVGRFVGIKLQEAQFEHYHAFTNDVPRHALLDLSRRGSIHWDEDVHELLDAVTGNWQRPTHGVTIFKESQGGVGDVAFASYLYHRCLELGRGVELDLRLPPNMR